jgi:hypothetical protein
MWRKWLGKKFPMWDHPSLATGNVMYILSITPGFWRDHPGLPCTVLAALSIAIGYFLFRPLNWRRFLERGPLFLVTGGPLFLMALANLPEALQKPFEWYLGHSIFEMVYEHQSSGTVFGELWTNWWWGWVGTLFDGAVLVGAIWAIVNLSRQYAVRSNVIALLLTFAWVCLLVWASAMSVLF